MSTTRDLRGNIKKVGLIKSAFNKMDRGNNYDQYNDRVDASYGYCNINFKGSTVKELNVYFEAVYIKLLSTYESDAKSDFINEYKNKLILPYTEKVKKIISASEITIGVARKIDQLTLDGDYIRSWDTISEANKEYNTKNICSCCRHRVKSVKGFRWCYSD